ncbi:MAG: glutaminyl-peptide cyclotransferase [Parvularcula sp.]
MFRLIFLAVLSAAGCSKELPTDAAPSQAPPEPAAEQAPAPASSPAPSPTQPVVWGYQVVGTFPHGEQYFTQGLFIHDGVLYESTGKHGESALIRHDFPGAASAANVKLPATVFGEGSVAVGDRIISLTWRDGIGFIYDLKSLEKLGEFDLPGEGWGITFDGERLIVSDGTDRLRFLDPDSFEEIGHVSVRFGDRVLTQLNELEYIDGEVWANIWQTDLIVRIDPATGQAKGFINLQGLYTDNQDPRDNVLNGIAWDPDARRLFVTGKRWPKIYEIRVPMTPPAP